MKNVAKSFRDYALLREERDKEREVWREEKESQLNRIERMHKSLQEQLQHQRNHEDMVREKYQQREDKIRQDYEARIDILNCKLAELTADQYNQLKRDFEALKLQQNQYKHQ